MQFTRTLLCTVCYTLIDIRTDTDMSLGKVYNNTDNCCTSFIVPGWVWASLCGCCRVQWSPTASDSQSRDVFKILYCRSVEPWAN